MPEQICPAEGKRMKEERKNQKLPKINSVHYGGIWIAAGLLIGAVLPVLLWIGLRKVIWPLVILGGMILAVFAVVFFLEMRQDFSPAPYYERNLKESIPYDPENQYAVIRSSICTGEKVAGFKNKADGHFTEVMLIRTAEDEDRFKKIYDLGTIKKEY